MKMVSILVVDFDASTRRTFKRILSKQGFSVDEAKEGEEAMKKLKINHYDAVLLSFQLPDMQGIDLLFFLEKSIPNAQRIIVTGFPSLSNTIQALEAGADAYFVKPVNPSNLVLVIEEKLRKDRKLPVKYN